MRAAAVVPVNIRYHSEPVRKLVLSRKLESIQIGIWPVVIVLERVTTKKFHFVCESLRVRRERREKYQAQ
jgi:hypothetical protein